MNILSFDTSTKSASVALMIDGVLVGEFLINDKKTHSQKLMPMLESLMQLANVSIDEIDLLAVCVGPGSFTGIRIAVSTIKAISHVRNLPVIGVNSLENIAFNAMDSFKNIIAVLDAQGENVYTAEYKSSNKSEYCIVDDIDVVHIDDLVNKIIEKGKEGNKYILLGEGLDKYRKKLDLENVEFVSPDKNISKASTLCTIALEKYKKNKDVFDCYTILPKYIRKSQAEVQYENKQKKLKE